MTNCRTCGQNFYPGTGYSGDGLTEMYCSPQCDSAASKKTMGIFGKGFVAFAVLGCTVAAWTSGHWWGYPLAIGIVVLGGKMLKS